MPVAVAVRQQPRLATCEITSAPTRRMKQLRIAVLGALLLTASPAGLISQTVRGRVIDRTSGVPVARGFVILLDSSGVEIARALSDDQGRFLMKAASAGSYRLQSKRIGFRASVSPSILLGAGEFREYDFEVQAIPLRLPTLVVTGRPQCGALEGALVGQLWEEIRAALAAVSWTSRQPYRYENVLYERNLDALGRSVRRERTRRRFGFFETPFRSAPPERLARDGYIVHEGGTRVFYGPDVNVVRSESFVQTHCFGAVAGTGRDTSLVGLAFEPVPASKTPDIGGTLWVDRATAELRHLDFRYVNLPPDLQDATLGGEVRFLALPSGGWIVREWWIRTPLRTWVETWTERELRVVGLQQTGGRVMGIVADGQPVYGADLATLSGTVFDETRSVPLAGAKLQLTGTPYTATTDAAGRFTLTGTMEGEYEVTFTHPRLDSLGYSPEPVSVPLRPGDVAGVRLTIPPERVIVTQLCPDTAAAADSYVLHGTVRDRVTRSPVSGAQVRVSWQEVKGWTAGMPIAVQGRLRPFILGERGATVGTDSLGRYLVCGVPSGRRVTVTAAQGRVGQTASLVFENNDGVWVGDAWTPHAGRIWQQDLTLGQGGSGSAAIVAVATDSTSGTPLAHAIVSLTGVEIRGVTDQAGRVTLGGVPPGTHTLVVRRIGYEVLERVVAVPGADTVRVAAGTLALKAVPFVLDTVVITGELEGGRWLGLVGFHERRKMGFGEFITRQEFERYVPSDVTDILRRLTAIGVRPNPNYGRPWAGGLLDPRRWIIGPGDACPALFFLDGASIGDARYVELDYVLGVNQIEAIEAYNGPAQVPVMFNRTGSQCGVVVLWTRR